MTRTYQLNRSLAGGPPREFAFLDELSEEQRAVASTLEGTLLVIAGAGSGKTRTLTYRVARLVHEGLDPSRLLLLTFTNKAAKEMTRRVAGLLGNELRLPHAGTFHAVAARLLREIAGEIGYPSTFGILDNEDAGDLMKRCIAEVVPRNPNRRFAGASVLLRILRDSQNRAESIDSILRQRFPQFLPDAADIERALVEYQSQKVTCGMMDFDDLLLHWLRVLKLRPDLAGPLMGRFDHVMVDEYQDTNIIQAELVDRMASRHGNLMVVGDDCQCIYSFRGAQFDNIIRFPERHAACRTFYLTVNYRSTPEIIRLTNESIAHNRTQFKKTLRSARPAGDQPTVVSCANEDEQSLFVVQRLLELRDEGVSLERIAVLYRSHLHSMALQVRLQQANVPFKVHSGQRFFEQRHIKDVVAVLRFVLNPRDEISFLRITGILDGVGPKTATRIFRHLADADFDPAALRDTKGLGLSKAALRSWEQFLQLHAQIDTRSGLAEPAVALDLIRRELYDDFASRVFDNAPNRLRELETLSTFASRTPSLSEFVAELALATSVTGVDEEREEPDEHLTLSSVHQAKGLEFDTVFVIWLTDAAFPSAFVEEELDLEEERRLFYVATTRAENRLYLTVPLRQWDRNSGWIVTRESPFVREVSRVQPPLMERWKLA